MKKGVPTEVNFATKFYFLYKLRKNKEIHFMLLGRTICTWHRLWSWWRSSKDLNIIEAVGYDKYKQFYEKMYFKIVVAVFIHPQNNICWTFEKQHQESFQSISASPILTEWCVPILHTLFFISITLNTAKYITRHAGRIKSILYHTHKLL